MLLRQMKYFVAIADSGVSLSGGEKQHLAMQKMVRNS